MIRSIIVLVVFKPFLSPSATDSQKAYIRTIAERLDAHRKRQQALHPALTITAMYNVLEKLRVGEELKAKEQEELKAKEQMIHEQGLISILLQLHNELDAAQMPMAGPLCCRKKRYWKNY